jgi:hypothetical protein
LNKPHKEHEKDEIFPVAAAQVIENTHTPTRSRSGIVLFVTIIIDWIHIDYTSSSSFHHPPRVGAPAGSPGLAGIPRGRDDVRADTFLDFGKGLRRGAASGPAGVDRPPTPPNVHPPGDLRLEAKKRKRESEPD